MAEVRWSADLDIAAFLRYFTDRTLWHEPEIPIRDLTDHAPINYVAPLMGLR